jgi:hypothetical protein
MGVAGLVHRLGAAAQTRGRDRHGALAGGMLDGVNQDGRPDKMSVAPQHAQEDTHRRIALRAIATPWAA